MSNFSFYLIADNTFCETQQMIAVIEQVMTSGITCVQLRMKLSGKKEIIKTAESLLKLLRPQHIPLIINDYIDIAKITDADGVHLGQSDANCLIARQELGSDKIVGLSIENIQQAKTCRDYNVDYFGVGPVFATRSKVDAAAPFGIEGLKEIINILSKPVVAIGGINNNNAAEVLSAGAKGVAVISAIFNATSPSEVAAQLAKTISAYE